MLKAKRNRLIAAGSPYSVSSEQYRTIRTNIYFSSMNQENRTLVITSPGAGEGKSTTAANLAVSMAQQGLNVLVVDADLRRPALHSIFQIDNAVGLTDVLMEGKTLQDAVKQTKIERLDILPSGPISLNQAELISSQGMGDLLKAAREQYDRVILDSSPVIEVTASRILANQCDGVILVLCSGKTNSQKAVEAKKLLDFARANVIGIVLNHK